MVSTLKCTVTPASLPRTGASRSTPRSALMLILSGIPQRFTSSLLHLLYLTPLRVDLCLLLV